MNKTNKSQSKLYLIFFSVVLVISALMLSLSTPIRADAATCYANNDFENVVTCPASVSQTDGCYSIPASSQGVGSPLPIECPSGTAADDTLYDGQPIENLRGPELTLQDQETAEIVRNNPIYTDVLLVFINFLTGGVALVVTTLVVVGGIEYMTAGGNPQKTQQAIQRISNALIGLVLYIFMYAILQWLIPGGIFG